MSLRAIVPPQRIVRIRPAPAEQFHPPRDRAVHHRPLLLIPHPIRRHIQCRDGGVNERVGGNDNDFLAETFGARFGPLECAGQIHLIALLLNDVLQRAIEFRPSKHDRLGRGLSARCQQFLQRIPFLR